MQTHHTTDDNRLALTLICLIAMGLMLLPALASNFEILGWHWLDDGWTVILVPIFWTLIIAGLAALASWLLGIEDDTPDTDYRDQTREPGDTTRREIEKMRHIDC
jgi:hypothetical protein